MKPTFLFYDYETFGTNLALDRPAQFAALRTDINFNPIGKPEIIYCCPPDDYLPQPEAVLITGITPQLTHSCGVNEAEFAKCIHKIFSVPNTCIIGYNNIRFDDEISRYLFYRNFYDPYSWGWENKNSRWDLLDVTRACCALRPDGIQWPKNNNGFPSFRLEHITKENHIFHDHAHDALSDVYATIALARLIKLKQPKLYNFFYTHRKKNQLKKLIKIPNMQILLYISGIFGNAKYNTTFITPLAWHPYNQNALIVYDLEKDVTPFLTLNSHKINSNLHTNDQSINRDAFHLPLKLIYINKCPIIAPANVLRVADAQRIKLDMPHYFSNFTKLKINPEILEKSILFYKKKQIFFYSENVDTQMYQSFFDNASRHIIHIIRHTAIEKLKTLNLTAYDHRIEKLLFRFRARNFAESLNASEKQDWLEYRRATFHPARIQAYIQKINMLYDMYQDNDAKKSLLKSLLNYTKEFISLLNTNHTHSHP
ncbi:exodeoxyribonuclease I [Candidatus Erwinia haradaeae]|uniref:Exodeoxyribonuclease I n=1 Tax=Candidatus Erwinia haradaeae TaxID=1922217 RepID=A0A451D1K8_9GAMM|nr:exodeoxyribonuclease I [Candidatus Erwinia haradaeae]VFP79490.1 Exodeoxyribonuclease I [Candidatus Erwinia haradaeae]